MSGYLPLGAGFDKNAPYNSIDKECPECGGCMNGEESFSGRYKWTDFVCSNCEYKEDNEPDWDLINERL